MMKLYTDLSKIRKLFCITKKIRGFTTRVLKMRGDKDSFSLCIVVFLLLLQTVAAALIVARVTTSFFGGDGVLHVICRFEMNLFPSYLVVY